MGFGSFLGPNDLLRNILREDWNVAKMECEMHPREARVWSTRVGFFDGETDSHVLPIHQAVAVRPTADFINALIIAYPQGVHSKESGFKRLPIHIAIQSSASIDVINVLLSYYPEGSHVKDILGRTPLHYACSNGASQEVIEALLGACPMAASMRDIHDWLPIHVACHFGCSTEVVRTLIRANPECLQVRTDKGSTPLKLVSKINCQNKKDLITILEEDAHKDWHGPMGHVPNQNHNDPFQHQLAPDGGSHRYSGLRHRSTPSARVA
eukprot:scaffold24999_cov47-Attheya_sp.AAC.2